MSWSSASAATVVVAAGGQYIQTERPLGCTDKTASANLHAMVAMQTSRNTRRRHGEEGLNPEGGRGSLGTRWSEVQERHATLPNPNER